MAKRVFIVNVDIKGSLDYLVTAEGDDDAKRLVMKGLAGSPQFETLVIEEARAESASEIADEGNNDWQHKNAATERARAAFWEAIESAFPFVTQGKLELVDEVNFQLACEKVVAAWLQKNRG